MYSKLADTLAKQEQFAAALPHYETALRIYPDCGWLRSNYGVALAETGRETEALEQIDRALAINPDRARTLLNLGMVRCRRGEFALAVDPLRRAASADPLLADAHHGLVMALAASGRRSEAIAQAREQAVEDARGRAEALADGAGVGLGELLSLTETSFNQPPPIPFAADRAFAEGEEAAVQTPVSPGTLEISVTVAAVYGIE